MADALRDLLGDKVQGKDGAEVDVASLAGDDKVIGIYCSAHWCPPCRAFTPILAEFYKKVHESKNLEIVFVSCDSDEASFEEYYSTMPWLAMPFNDKYKDREELLMTFGIQGIPSLTFFDGNGQVITTEGRGEVDNDPEGKNFPSWKQ